MPISQRSTGRWRRCTGRAAGVAWPCAPGAPPLPGALRNFGALAGVGDLAFKVLPLQAKLRIGVPAMARIFSQISDQHSTVEEHENEFIYTIHRCPVCWGRKGLDKPVCFMATGLLQEGLKWLSGGNEFRVNEAQCMAMGDRRLRFHHPEGPDRLGAGSIVAEEKPTLLIVEDDLDVADMLNAYFRVQGYEVLTVNWGEEAVRACQTNQPDLVILDIRLPDIDGFEVARRLRDQPPDRRTSPSFS